MPVTADLRSANPYTSMPANELIIQGLRPNFSAAAVGGTRRKISLVLDFLQQNFSVSGPIAGASINFSRSSSGSYFGSDGLLKSAGNNVARYDYDPVTLIPRGLLVEQASTNITPNSESFGGFGVSGGVTKTNNVYVAPDGNTTAGQYVSTAAGNTFIFTTTTAATAYTQSIFLKYVSGSGNLQIGSDTIASSQGLLTINAATFAFVSAGSSVTGYTITPCGNGWYRITVSWVATTTSHSFVIATTSTNLTMAFWGFQMENLPFATSYIKTSGGTVTRSADVCNIGVGSWYSQSQGTWMSEWDNYGIANSPRILADNNNTILDLNGSTGVLETNNGVTTLATANSTTINTKQKAAVAFSFGSRLLCLNGGTVASDSVTHATGVSSVYLGNADATASTVAGTKTSLNGHLRLVRFYNYQLTAAQLKQITA